jgi:hypothetical protein
MQQFVVPQFIDIEPKIIGPITARQFVLIMIGMGLMFLAYKTADIALFVMEAILILLIVGTFAFVKINGRPFHFFMLNVIQTFKKPKIRVWAKQVLPEKVIKGKKIKGEKAEAVRPPVPPKKLPRARLSDLSLLVNTGGVYREEE